MMHLSNSVVPLTNPAVYPRDSDRHGPVVQRFQTPSKVKVPHHNGVIREQIVPHFHLLQSLQELWTSPEEVPLS